jgi:hypothetical protein
MGFLSPPITARIPLRDQSINRLCSSEAHERNRVCIAFVRDCIIPKIGMTAESILERISQNPFRPIAVKTIGGTLIEINQQEDIFIYDRMKTTCVVLFDPAGRKFVYAPEQITTIEARGMESA